MKRDRKGPVAAGVIIVYFLCFWHWTVPVGYGSTTADMVGLVSSMQEANAKKGDKTVIGKVRLQGAISGISGIRVADVEVTSDTLFQEEGKNLSKSNTNIRLLKRGLGVEVGFEKGANLEAYPAKVTAASINIVHRGEKTRKRFG